MDAYGATIKAGADKYFSNSYSFFYPDIVIEKAYGPYVYGTDGRRYIDATSAESFANFGHRHEEIQEAMRQQMGMLVSMCGCNFNYPSQARLAKVLVLRMSNEFSWSLFFTNSGAESIEGAMKLAQYVTGRPAFLAFRGCFHGRTLGALNLTFSNPIQRKGFCLNIPVEHRTFGDVTALDRWYFDIDHPGRVEPGFLVPQDIAAVFVEPIQGYGGVNVAPPGFLQYIRDFCDKYSALMVVDEIQTGLGRTGTFWAFEHDGVVPDVVCSAKALGGGLPLGAVIAKKKLLDQWKSGAHGSSGGGNPVACAAGFRLLSLINGELLCYVREEGGRFMTKLQEALVPNSVTGRGYMVGVEFSNTTVRNAVMQESAKRGLLMLKANRNFEDRSIRLLPPLITPREVFDETVSILKDSLQVIEN